MLKKGLLLCLLAVALLTGACSAPASEPLPPTLPPMPEGNLPGEGGVPGATLTTSQGNTQQGAAGTHCWGGMCVDMVGIIVPGEALAVAPDEVLTFTLTAGEPSGSNLRVLEWQLSEFDEGGATRIIDPAAPVVASGDLDAATTIEWQAPVEPGEYAVSLFTTYVEGGDISYGWHIIVE